MSQKTSTTIKIPSFAECCYQTCSAAPSIASLLVLFVLALIGCQGAFANTQGKKENGILGEKRSIGVADVFSVLELGGMGNQGLSVSPNGRYVAFQMHQANTGANDYEVYWYVLDLEKPLKNPVLIGTAGDPVLFRGRNNDGRINGSWNPTDPVWSPDSQWVAYRLMNGGTVQIWRSSFDGRIQERLTDNNTDIDAFYWSDDDSTIWYQTDATAAERAQLSDSMWKNGVQVDADRFWPYLRPNLMDFLEKPYDATAGQSRIWALDLDSGRTRQATSDETQRHLVATKRFPPLLRNISQPNAVQGHPLASGITVHHELDHLTWKEPESNNRIHVRLNNKNESAIRCVFDECSGEIGEMFWGQDGEEVLFWRSGKGPDDGRTGSSGRSIAIIAWDIDKNTVRTVYTDWSRQLSACSSTGRSLVCFSDNMAKPRTIVEVDFKDGAVTEIFDPNPKFGEVRMGHVERIEWGNEIGARTFGWFVKPIDFQAGARYPLVIIQYTTRDCFRGGTGAETPAHLFSAEGIAVLCLEYASMLGDKDNSRSPSEPRRAAMLTVESAIDVLDRKGLIDVDRVGITGLSFGEDMTSYTLSHSRKFAAAATSSFVWEPSLVYFFASASQRKRWRSMGLGRPGTPDGASWSEISPSRNPDQIHTPILVQTSDGEAPYAMVNYVTLQEEKRPIDMYVYRDEYHVKWWPQNKQAVAVRAVDWMRFWLKGELDHDPAKVEQYAHWHTLCEQHIANLSASEDPALRRRGENQPCERTLH